MKTHMSRHLFKTSHLPADFSHYQTLPTFTTYLWNERQPSTPDLVTARPRVAHGHFPYLQQPRKPQAFLFQLTAPHSTLHIPIPTLVSIAFFQRVLPKSHRCSGRAAMSNSRPPPAQGIHSRGQGTSIAPTTPRKSGKDLSGLIDRFNQQWQLGLARDETWSPQRQTNDLPDKVYTLLKQSYWWGDFPEVIGQFSLKTLSLLGNGDGLRIERLTLLRNIIEDVNTAKGRSSGSKSRTPAGGSGLIPRLRALQTDQSCEFHSLFLKLRPIECTDAAMLQGALRVMSLCSHAYLSRFMHISLQKQAAG